MGKYNFDENIDRKGSNCVKFDQLGERFGNSNAEAFWIADMDFKCDPNITNSIIEKAKHGVLGYTFANESYYQSIIDWERNFHNWNIQKDWIHFIPGVVKGIAFALNCFLKEGDKVIIQPPVYPPFKNIPTLNGFETIENTLKLENGFYTMDLDDLESIMKNNSDAKMLILCNPHNPIGISWSKEILIKVAELCDKYKILVVSDEIHADLAYESQGFKHIPFASVSKLAADNSITLMAPSKSFNIAGIISSFSIIPNNHIREKFNEYLERAELNSGHIFAYTATEAAYTHGKDWLLEAKDYLWENILLVEDYLKNNIPQIKMFRPQASFLIWLDCSSLNLADKELDEFFLNKAGLALNSGYTFGKAGSGFMRFNIGTTKENLQKGLKKLKEAVNSNK